MKGWTVVTKGTQNGSQGVADREEYYLNIEHPNHVKTTSIEPIWGGRNHIARIAFNGESSVSKARAKGKGGRPPTSFAVEFTLNFPKGYQPSNDQWQAINKDVIIAVAKALEVEANALAEQCRSVVHRQDQTPDIDPKTGAERGTGDHMHLLIGKFLPDGKHLRNLQRKTITHVVKETFNRAAIKHCGFDWRVYRDTKLVPQEHKNKRKVPTWKVKAAREIQAIKKHQQALDERAKALSLRAQELDAIEANIEDQLNDVMAIKRLKDNFINQVNKWLQAFKDADQKQMNRQYNRVGRTVTELARFEMEQEQKEFLGRLLDSVNEKTDKPKDEQISLSAIKVKTPRPSP